ncbi:hypothetical protein DAETH_07950 [Deinococcus aetherius]|uniref:Uncharacterized protein n=1 Tax=Deinococcus aetherius TaxID=200252 RepID=A0ABM8AB38_9DEIO|nr:hypothetical protein [Deinococcus aetherius]BDP40826.1 hypothetical protein DAETH_07950 [Deinococcus aetherius]
MGEWLTLAPISRLTLPYALALGLIAAYWLGRVAGETRRRRVPRAAWWGVPGLALLWLTPLLEVPALFSLGAALLLFAEFWPGAFRYTRARPGPSWPLALLLSGLTLLGLIAARGGTGVSVAAALALLLGGVGGLLAAGLFPAGSPAPRLPGLEVRFGRVRQPEWPDLSVTLTGEGARLVNVSSGPVHLAGWSPSGVNAWLRVRDEGGAPLNRLAAGQSALLPLGERAGGVRVWYVPEGRGGRAEPRLFRADWTPPAYADSRVLN